MILPIFSVCSVDSSVVAAFGSPVRIYDFGEAPQDVAMPYAVWQIIGGQPENYLGDAPDLDGVTVQFDVYGNTASEVEVATNALRDCIQSHAHIVSWRGRSRDPDTRHYRCSFDVDWWVFR